MPVLHKVADVGGHVDPEADSTLIAWLERDLGRRRITRPSERLVELVEQAVRSIKRHLDAPKKLRPSAVAIQLAKLSKRLEAAARHAAKLGDQGLLHIVVASGANIDDETVGMTAHVLYLERMGDWSKSAAETAKEISLSLKDHKGGPTPNRNLRHLIADLLLTYEHILGIRASHTVDKASFVAEVGFTGFVKQALSIHQPEGMTFEPGLIDNVVREMLGVRLGGLVDPPRRRKASDSKRAR